jgi:hypothetical protein
LREVFVKRFLTPFAVVLIAFALADCRGRENASAGSTETIAPATPQPGPSGTDAMTQTVDIEDSRSEADGASLTSTSTMSTSTTAPSTTATSTTATTTTTTAPPKRQ